MVNVVAAIVAASVDAGVAAKDEAVVKPSCDRLGLQYS